MFNNISSPEIIYQTCLDVQQFLESGYNSDNPDHAAGMAGRVIVPAGNLMFHSMEYKYSSEVTDEKNAKRMKEAAIQTAVQAIRFLENLK